jgi:hypothetical protein
METATLSAGGKYAYLKHKLQEGNSLTLPIGSTFSLILDVSRGAIPGGNDAAQIEVTANGITGNTQIIPLRCDRKPTVKITYPAEDTTILVSPLHQPIITLEEEHTPLGQFEPEITWVWKGYVKACPEGTSPCGDGVVITDSSNTIDTKDCFELFQDTMKINAEVKADNIFDADGASRGITLKKVEDLDHFIVNVVPDTIGSNDCCIISAIAVGKEGKEAYLDDRTSISLTAEPDNIGAFSNPVVVYKEIKAGNAAFYSFNASETQEVIITVTGDGKSGTGKVVVVGEEECIFVEPSAKKLPTGEITLLYIRQTVGGGIPEDFPPDQLFDIQLSGPEGESGIMQASDGTTGTSLIGVAQPITYIAPPSISEDSIVVYFMAVKSGGGAASSVRVPTKTSIKDSVKTSLKKAGLSLRIANILRAQGTIGGCPLGNVTIVKDSLDHFDVKVMPDTAATKDTVAFTEGAKLVIQAKDKENKNVELDVNSILKFSLLTNEEYGTFINANNDTLKTTPVLLENVRYGDTKDGKIKFAAVKKNPDSLVTCKVRVEMQNDAEKKGDTTIVVLEQTLKIVMDNPHEVRPSIPTEDGDQAMVALRRKPFEVRMTRGGKPVGNHPFRLWTNYVVGSGGHDHGDTRDVRRENNDDSYGYFTVGQSNRHRRPFDTLTNAKGIFSISYNTSIFGDTMKIYLKSKSKLLLSDSISVIEKVDSLINFRNVASGSQWTFSQSTTGEMRHPDNNWCMPGMRDSLKNAIGKFYEWSKGDFGTTIVLSLNDMSLILGGRFDMSGKWDGRYSQAHLYHRTGKSVDINEPSNDSCKIKRDLPKGKWEWTKVGEKLVEIFKKCKLDYEYERYIHFELRKPTH